MNTPDRKNTNELAGEESLLGSYYRLKSFRKLVGYAKKGSARRGGGGDQNFDENAIYTTPVRSSRRINSRRNELREEFHGLESPTDTKSGKILVTPNPYIGDDVVEQLLNDVLLKYRDRIQIVSFGKQPQVLDEIENLDTEFNSKLQICESDSNTVTHSESEGPTPQEKIESKESELASSKPTRKEYFVCRNRPRKVIGGGSGAGPAASNTAGKYQVIAENEYWMVVEFPKNSALYRKHNCSRILTQKRVMGAPVSYPAVQSIEGYKALHSELKQLLELSNYCYSPDLF
ncbi:hypothetical protein OJ253_3293 [Cryptosporidium canis]|uniref:Uncharacterized protein n=1 Tax=Cryptosporidium canis TaxID=195482 RepID=A0A9D5DEB5_9CRYT|nr:hypothetical protein OJ253_3293 [Cryptosporidium canis]